MFDNNGDKKISKLELKYGLEDYGVPLNNQELEQVMIFFDRDKSGAIDFDELLRGLRGEMNQRRLDLVDMAFKALDCTGDGRVTIDDLRDSYDVTSHPGVQAGLVSKEQALKDFLNQWDRTEKDGVVTREEFIDYYRDISASIPEDVYFELCIRNSWRISGGEGHAANTANLRVLATHPDGRQVIGAKVL